MTQSEYTNDFIRSPNFRTRGDDDVQFIVLHCTDLSYEKTKAAFENHHDEDPSLQVSAHYVVNTDGFILCMVQEENAAYHAGVSYWRGVNNVNDTSIGIEIVGYENQPYQYEEQLNAVKKLCLDIINRYPRIKSYNIVGHSDVATVNDKGLRKGDPGIKFPWADFADSGIGINLLPLKEDVPNYMDVLYKHGDKGDEIANLHNLLNKYGYQIKNEYPCDLYDDYFANVVYQFKLHFVPELFITEDVSMDKNWNVLADFRLRYLLQSIDNEDSFNLSC